MSLRISQLINRLEAIRSFKGDVEIYEAVQEYGQKEITETSLQTLIRSEVIHYAKPESRFEEIIVIGRH